MAATNRNLKDWVERGNFRADLYYRLNVIQCCTPSLRQLREDIPELIDHFIRKFQYTRVKPTKGISDEALKLVLRYDWPGNIRELQNAIERAMVVGKSELLEPEDLPDDVIESSDLDEPGSHMQTLVDQSKKTAIEQALQKAGGNISQAARELGINRRHLYRLMRELRVNRP